MFYNHELTCGITTGAGHRSFFLFIAWRLKSKFYALIIIVLLLGMGIGYGIGYGAAIDKCVKTAMKYVNIEIPDYVLKEILIRYGGNDYNASILFNQGD